MFRFGTIFRFPVALLLSAGIAQAEDKEKEPSAIVEIGPAGEWSLRDGTGLVGPSVAVEITPIPEWLELEAGFSPLFGTGHPEWSTDFLFKKPYTLSTTVEFMVGVGPEWSYTSGGGKLAGEFALDFMFWPSPARQFGWFLEPTYSYSLGRGHEQALGVSVGLLIAIP
jgi:hypothetical protein